MIAGMSRVERSAKPTWMRWWSSWLMDPLVRARGRGAAPSPPRQGAGGAWNLSWSILAARFARAEITAALQTAAKTRTKASSTYGQTELLDLAFGAYVGLVREQGTLVERKKQGEGVPPPGHPGTADRAWPVAGVGLSPHPRFVPGVVSVLIQALGDPHQAVRLQAFEHLQDSWGRRGPCSVRKRSQGRGTPT